MPRALPVRRPWLLALGGQRPQEPALLLVDPLVSPLPAWATVRPWPHVKQLSSLLWDMVPVDVCAFEHVAQQAAGNPVALLLMALINQPSFVMDLAEAVSMGLCITAAGMATTLHRILWDFDSERFVPFDQHSNTAAVSHMLGMCTTMLNLGMLRPSDDLHGVALGAMGTRYHLVSIVPPLLKACYLITGSHYLPIVSVSQDIPGYMASWAKLLPRLPDALNVHHADLYPYSHVMRKLLVWQRSRFQINMPITVGMAASWCRDSLPLTCSNLS